MKNETENLKNEIDKSTEMAIKLFIELAKSNRGVLQQLKKVAVKYQNYQLGINLRDIETAQFPRALETDSEYKEAEKLKGCLSMTGLNCSAKAAYTIIEVYKKYQIMQGNFDIDTASRIKVAADEIFGDE